MSTTINADNGAISGSAGLKSSSDGTGILALQTNGTTAISIDSSQVVTFTNPPIGVGSFATGTVMLFVQTSAPTGWTKSTTHNNKTLRVVSGTASSGGSVAFTTAFASQTPSGTVSVSVSAGTLAVGIGTLANSAFTLTTSEIPSHTHTITPVASTGSGGSGIGGGTTRNSGATGGGGSHNHTLSGSPSLSGAPSVTSATFSGTAIDLAVQYVDVIIATKD